MIISPNSKWDQFPFAHVNQEVSIIEKIRNFNPIEFDVIAGGKLFLHSKLNIGKNVN